MNICVDARLLNYSGIGTYLRNIICRLQKAGLSLKLIVSEEKSEKGNELNSFDLIPCNARPFSLKEQLLLPKLIPACDVFWTPHFNIPFLPIRAKKRLVTIHDVFHLVHGETLSLSKRLCAKYIIPKAIKSADRVITVSQFSYQEIAKHTGLQCSHISTITLGVDHDHFHTSSDKLSLDIVRAKYALPEKFILFVSNISFHKNLAGLLNAFRILIEQGATGYQLVIIGKKLKIDDYTERLLQDPIISKYIRYVGIIDYEDLPKIYQLAATSVTPSLYEGFGLPPLEAMACGCPTLVSKIASLPEVCGDAAEYINPHEPEDIAKGLIKVLEDDELRRSLIEKGFIRAKKFSWDDVAEKHLRVIEELCRV